MKTILVLSHLGSKCCVSLSPSDNYFSCCFSMPPKGNFRLRLKPAAAIIEKVDRVSRWCSLMSFVPKPNGGVRSVVDLVQLNKFVDRPTHPFPASKDIVSRIPTGSKCFAVFDCTHGYWQIPLEEESRSYTCFMSNLHVADKTGATWVLPGLYQITL